MASRPTVGNIEKCPSPSTGEPTNRRVARQCKDPPAYTDPTRERPRRPRDLAEGGTAGDREYACAHGALDAARSIDLDGSGGASDHRNRRSDRPDGEPRARHRSAD